ncbi:hypothetical protein PVAND_012669 [Polypedilum vanderplanki]|uniref:G-protein coupled receptors family 2 profile 2 domain-containing protein n=1 Tax=Polypedilum vanderplanki TaxID=319348 RepID=A0A9J6CN60_POLVA|nr:hypothetical protein PVAND_012669 [Polypedilum vanderplanki]
MINIKFPFFHNNSMSYSLINSKVQNESETVGIKPENNITKYSKESSKRQDAKFTIFPTGMFISAFFFFLTIVVFASIPDLRNLHGKCLMCNLIGLDIFYFTLTMIQVYNDQMMDVSLLCYFAAYTTYFTLFIAFVWLSIVSFDLCRRFTNISYNSKEKSFKTYAIIGFGTSIFCTVLVFIIDNFQLLPQKYLPRIALYRCWVSKELIVELIYIYIPMSALAFSYVGFFVVTFYKIWKAQKKSNDILSQKAALKSRLYTFTRLFMVMGVSWCCETFSYVFGKDLLIFEITDVFNSLIGLFTFIIVCILNPTTRNLIIERLRNFNKN